MRILPFACLALAVFAPGAARAEKGAITIAEVTIVGRVQKPVAAVDVSKLRAKITLSELKQPFVDRIEDVTRHPPF